MLKTQLLAALVVGVLAAPVAANAAPVTVTQLIHFDDAPNNGVKWYSDVDNNFLFDPTNLQSGNCADSTNGGNGSCVIEGGQTVVPLMTRPQSGPYEQQGQTLVQSQGSSKDPIVNVNAGDQNQLFTLDSFYFFLTGQGTAASNSVTVTDETGFSFTLSLGTAYPVSPATSPVVSFYGDKDHVAGAAAGVLDFNIGYVVTFGDLFKDVTSIQFSAADSAQVRIDCVVATFVGTTTEPLSGFKAGCGLGDGGGGQNEIPEPGSLALAGLALLGAYAVRRRKL